MGPGGKIDPFTVVWSVNESEAGVYHVWMETSVLLGGFYQNKVNSSLSHSMARQLSTQL